MFLIQNFFDERNKKDNYFRMFIQTFFPECGKMFGRQVMLLRHIRVHTSIKPYKCIQCDYKSYKGGNIVLHARKVHGRQGTIKDVVTLMEEKAAMDAMVETILTKEPSDNVAPHPIQRTVGFSSSNIHMF